MAEIEGEKAEITARLSNAPEVQPGIAEIHKRKVARLTETLGDPDARLDASSDVRSLTGKIDRHPGDKRGEVHATLHGSLVGILDLVKHPELGHGRARTKLVSSGSPGR